ncbi:MAG: HAMP domain-containing protein [Thainema sp.]
MAQPPSDHRSNSPPNDHPAPTNGTEANGARPNEWTESAIAPTNADVNNIELTESELAELEQSAASSPHPNNGYSTFDNLNNTVDHAGLEPERLGGNGSGNGLQANPTSDNLDHRPDAAAFDEEFELEPPVVLEPDELGSDADGSFIALPPQALPRPPFWHRLETKAAAIALLCGLLSGALVGGGVYLATSRLLSQQAKQIQTQQTGQLAENIAAFLRDRTQEISQIASSTTLTSAGFWNQPLADKQQVINRLQEQQSRYATLAIFNRQGQKLVQAPGEVDPALANPAPAADIAPPADVAPQPATPNLGNSDAANVPAAEPVAEVAQPVAEPEPVAVGIQQVLTSQQMAFTPSTTPGMAFDIAAPIQINGQLVGVLQAQIAVDTVQPAFVPAADQPNQSYLVQSDGTLLNQSDAAVSDQLPESVVAAWPELTQSNPALVEQDSYWVSAVPVALPAAGLDDAGLSAVWVQPELGVRRLPPGVAYTVGIGALLAGLGSGVLGAWAASRTTRSLRQATQTIQDLERDRRSPTLAIAGRGEVAMLGRSVQSLANHIDQTRQTHVLELTELQEDVDTARQQAEAIRDRIQHLQQEHQHQLEHLQADVGDQQATWQQSTEQLRADHARQVEAIQADYRQLIEQLQQEAKHSRHQQEEVVQQLETQRHRQLDELRAAMQAVNQGNFDQPLPETTGELKEIAQAYSLTVRHLHQARQQQARSQTRLAEIISQLDHEIQSLQTFEQSFDPLAMWPTADQSLRAVSATLHNLTQNMQQLKELAQTSDTTLADASATQPIASLQTLHQSSGDLQQQLEHMQPGLQQMMQTVLELSQITGQITLLTFNASLNLSRLPGDIGQARQPLAKRLGQLRSLSQQSTQKTQSLTQQMAHFQQAITQVSPQVAQIATQVLGNIQSLTQLQQQLDHLAKLQQTLLPQLEQTQQSLAAQAYPIMGTLEAMQDAPSLTEQARVQLAQITTALQEILAVAHQLANESFNQPNEPLELNTDSHSTLLDPD